MIELTVPQYGAAVPLFRGIPHNRPVVFGVLEGHNAGRVFVDGAASPATALVCAAGNFFYLAGTPADDFLGEAAEEITRIQRAGPDRSAVVFAFDEAWLKALDRTLAPLGAIRIGRRIFRFDEDRFLRIKQALPEAIAGYGLKRMDEAAAGQAGAMDTWDQAEFKEHGFGCAAWHGHELAGACHTVFMGAGYAELSVFTAECHARKGLATMTASAALDECLRRGLEPCWTCWDFNEPSANLAKKLGFVEQPMAQAHYWELKE